MKIRCFSKNKNNKIEFTETELKQLLDEVYNDGYSDGQVKNKLSETWWWYPNSDWGINPCTAKDWTITTASSDYSTTSTE